jgi:hypothetical protein
MSGLGPTDGTGEEDRKRLESEARRLQKYFYLLGGCKIPIEHADAVLSGKQKAYMIFMTMSMSGASEWHASIRLHRETNTYSTPVLYMEDEEIVRFVSHRDGKRTETERPRALLNQALNAFGQKYFGVPVSAIDDPKFDWAAHHTNTLAISYADFQPIQFPPEKQ